METGLTFERTLLYVMNLFFAGYIAYIWIRYGVQPSVSESYYRLKRRYQWLFTFATWGYALPALMLGLQLTGNGIVFLAGMGIAFVGASPAFHGIGMERTVHTVGALVGITAMHVFLCIEGYWYITATFVALSLVVFAVSYLRENITWWVEILAFLSISAAYKVMVDGFVL
jgi:hypothetical protein